MAIPSSVNPPPEDLPKLKGAKAVGRLVAEWKDWREYALELRDANDERSLTQLDHARRELKRLRKTINSFIRGNTELMSYANRIGYTPAGKLMGNHVEKKPKPDGTKQIAAVVTKDKNKGKGNNRPGGGDGKGGDDDDLLPGKRGRDYRLIVDKDGDYSVIYSYKLPNGKRVKTGWDVDEKDFDKFQLDKSMAVRLSEQQLDRIHFFGNAKDITRKNAGNMHPLKKFLKGLHEQYGGASWLRDKEYMSIVIMGHMENWDKTAIANRLRRTDWYQSKTAYQRRWQQTYTKEDREQEVTNWTATVRDYLRQAFGNDVNWREHIDPEQVDRWINKLASGRWGDPADGWNRLQTKILGIARKVEGTTAQFEDIQQAEQRRAWENEPELVFEELRKQMIYQLGYKHKLDNATLRNWAESIAREKDSMADFAQYIRKLKKNLLPYLDPDEAWQDRAATYKSIAEELFGKNLSWKDKLLADLTKKDKDGAPLKNGAVAIDAWEFEKMVRQDDRFKQSRTYNEESTGLLNFLNETFNGVTGGQFPATLG